MFTVSMPSDSIRCKISIFSPMLGSWTEGFCKPSRRVSSLSMTRRPAGISAPEKTFQSWMSSFFMGQHLFLHFVGVEVNSEICASARNGGLKTAATKANQGRQKRARCDGGERLRRGRRFFLSSLPGVATRWARTLIQQMRRLRLPAPPYSRTTTILVRAASDLRPHTLLEPFRADQDESGCVPNR